MKLGSMLVLGGVVVSLALAAVFAAPASTQESSREDFQEFCKANQGRWVGDVTWVMDVPGFGKKGEKVTAYSQRTIAEDGNALVSRFYGGNGSGTELIVFDAGAKQIKSMGVGSNGATGTSILYKSRGKWVEKGAGSLPDGTKSEGISTLTFADNGNTLTVTGSATVGGEKIDDQHDVWRRVSK